MVPLVSFNLFLHPCGIIHTPEKTPYDQHWLPAKALNNLLSFYQLLTLADPCGTGRLMVSMLSHALRIHLLLCFLVPSFSQWLDWHSSKYLP